MRCINPSVEAPAQIVDDGVRVVCSQAGVKLAHCFGFAVAVCVADQPDIRSGRGDHAILVEHEARDQFEAFIKNLFLVGAAIAVAID